MNIIIGCIIANLITFGLIIGILYYYYNKNKDKINQIITDITLIIDKLKLIDFEAIKNSINEITSTINEIKEKIDKIKFPF